MLGQVVDCVRIGTSLDARVELKAQWEGLPRHARESQTLELVQLVKRIYEEEEVKCIRCEKSKS